MTSENSVEILTCALCDKDLSVSLFRKCKSSKTGYGNRCKNCLKKKYAESVSNKEYKEKLAKQRADNHIKNREKYNERHKVDFQKNKENIYERRKIYYQNNPDKAMAERHRQHIRNTMKSGKEAPELLGCSNEHLAEWFEFHFTIDIDMNFDNHGDYWHIDHVLPINKWDLNKETHQKLCFNWKNLMPLKTDINISKHDNINLDQVKELDRRLKLFSEIKGEQYEMTPVQMFLN